MGLPKCRGCKTILRDRNKPRIMVDCLFYPKFSSPYPLPLFFYIVYVFFSVVIYPGQVAFCLNVDCIRKGTFSDCTIHSKDIFKVAFINKIVFMVFNIVQYPHWDGTVGVPGEIWNYLKEELAQHKQIKWELV